MTDYSGSGMLRLCMDSLRRGKYVLAKVKNSLNVAVINPRAWQVYAYARNLNNIYQNNIQIAWKHFVKLHLESSEESVVL